MINTILGIIGNTPLVRLSRIENVYEIKANLYAKLEWYNPFGSVKDRAAFTIIQDAIKNGRINNDTVIIDATSGNMGISLAAISKLHNLRCTIVMPEDASQKRKDLLKIYGAKYILTSAQGGIEESICTAQRIAEEQSNFFFTNQFENTASIEAHQTATAPEIERDLGKKPDIVISGIGTGGTIMGIAKYYEIFATQIYGVIPSKNSKIAGLRREIHSPIIDSRLLSGIIPVTDSKLINIQNDLLRYEGIFAGYSSCATLYACLELSSFNELNGEDVVLIFPDSGERYI